MNTSKKFKYHNLNEGESPEENNILDDLQVLVNVWREDNTGNISPISSLQQLIDDYHSKPLNEMVDGDQEWHTKEQGNFFTLDGSENLGNTEYFKDDGFDIIHQSSENYHLSDISPESDETYIPKGSKKIKKTVLKPRLDKGPFNVSMLDEQQTEGIDNNRYNDVNKIDVAIMNHIVRDNSIADLEELVNSAPESLIDTINEIVKLYGFNQFSYKTPIRIKKLVQLIWNNPGIKPQELMGSELPPMTTYTFTKQFEEIEHVTKEASVDIIDTNFTSAICAAEKDFWEYDPEVEHLDTWDSEMTGDDFWSSIDADGVLVYQSKNEGGKGKGEDTKYDPNNNNNC